MSTQETKAMTVGDWIVTFLILIIPLVGIVMPFVWAFSSDTQPSKKTFFQAQLIVAGIFLVLIFIALFLFGGMAAIMNAQQHAGSGA